MNYRYSITLLLAITFCCTIPNNASSITMNKCEQPDGRIEFTDRPCPSDTRSSPIENKILHQPIRQSSQQLRPQTIRELPTEDRLKSCDPQIAIAAAEEIIHNPASMKEPMQMFSPAFTLFQNGRKDDGVFWFYAAQLRVRQQMVVENGDRGQILSIMQMTIGAPINNYAFQNTSNLNLILDRVLEWDKHTLNPFRDKALLQKLDKKIDQVYVGFNELKSKLTTEKTALEIAARQAAPKIEQMYAQMNSQRCRKGQPDPAYENQMKKEEEQLALDYIKHNDQVIKLAGGAVKAFPASSTVYSYNKNKGRYDFPIEGQKGSANGTKGFYAIVDVNRQSGKPEFSLACVTTLSLGAREAFKDVCSQSTIPLPK